MTARALSSEGVSLTSEEGFKHIERDVDRQKRLSVIIPAYNEESNIKRAYEEICAVFETLCTKYSLEIIFLDNHSSDQSFRIIKEIAEVDKRVKALRFSRNFGFHKSILTGYRLASGAAAMQIDCDLQDPPDVLLEFVGLWERGHDVVVGVRRSRSDGHAFQSARKYYYRILQALSDDGIVVDSGDFRLLDRTVLDQLRQINDAAPYVRGLSSQLAARPATVLYDRKPRMSGESKFPLRSLISFAVSGLLAHSTVPLRLASYTGLVVALITLMASIGYILLRLTLDIEIPSGFTTTTVLLLIGISLNSIFLGIIGEYLGRIYNQIRIRPTTVVEESVNVHC